MEFTVVRKDGTYRYVDVSAFLTQLGKQKVILCTAVEVTRRKVQQFFKRSLDSGRLADCARLHALQERSGQNGKLALRREFPLAVLSITLQPRNMS